MFNKRKITQVYVFTTQEGSWELKAEQPDRFELKTLDIDEYLGNADKFGF